MSVFVGGIPYTLSKSEFLELAKDKIGADKFNAGAVEVNLLLEGPGSDRNKGFGFVKCTSNDLAAEIVEKANSGVSSQSWTIGNVSLKLRLSQSKIQNTPVGAGSTSTIGRGFSAQSGRGRGGADFGRGRGGPIGRGPSRYGNDPTSTSAGGGFHHQDQSENTPVNLPLALAWAHYKEVLAAPPGTPLPSSLSQSQLHSEILETVETPEHLFVVLRKNSAEVVTRRESRLGRGRGGTAVVAKRDDEWEDAKSKLEAAGFRPTSSPSLKRMRDAAGDPESRAATKEEIMQAMLELHKPNGKFVAISELHNGSTVVLVPRAAVKQLK